MTEGRMTEEGGHAMPKGKLRHIAISVPDKEREARFYEESFGFTRQSESAVATRLCDGAINLTLLTFPTDEQAGDERGKDFVGMHHFGVWFDDMAEGCKAVEAAGGTHKPIADELETTGAEKKYRGHQGVVFDVSVGGWHGAVKDEDAAVAASPAKPGGGRIRHLAIAVPDLEDAAKFYEAAFGFTRARQTKKRIYMSDGLMNITLLPSDDLAGDPRSGKFVGIHHLGVLVDDVKAAMDRMEKVGGVAVETPKEYQGAYAEAKYWDPYGIMVDVTTQNWAGAR
jgi:methylmalonyl-CoA/ethylmalonyl-CoA epimerase